MQLEALKRLSYNGHSISPGERFDATPGAARTFVGAGYAQEWFEAVIQESVPIKRKRSLVAARPSGALVAPRWRARSPSR